MPDYLFGSQQRLWLDLETVAISGSTATVTLAGAQSGAKILCYYLFVQVTGAAANLTFQSNTTDISGAIVFASANDSLTFSNAGNPVLISARGEALNIGNSNSGNTTIVGFAIVGYATE